MKALSIGEHVIAAVLMLSKDIVYSENVSSFADNGI
jgi:hypothetical protein